MLEAAKLSLQRAISLNPKNAELHYQLARLYFTLGSFVDSIEESKRALALSPDYAEVYQLRQKLWQTETSLSSITVSTRP